MLYIIRSLNLGLGINIGVVEGIPFESDDFHAELVVHLPESVLQGRQLVTHEYLAPFSTSPSEPIFSGLPLMSWKGTRCASIRSAVLAFLMLKKSSFVATSPSGTIVFNYSGAWQG